MSSVFFHYIIVLSICFMYVCSELEMRERYLNVRTLENIAIKIYRLFDGINSSSTNAKNNDKIAERMERIVNSIADYDRLVMNVDYLDEFDFGDKQKFGNFKDLKAVTMSLIRKIHEDYQRFKGTVYIFKNESHNVLPGKPAEYPDVMKWSDQLHTIITFEDPNDSTTFLQQVLLKTEWLLSRRCDLHLPPIQFTMFQIYLTLVSSQLKSFAVHVLDLQYRYVIDKVMPLKSLDEKLARNFEAVKKKLNDDSLHMKSFFNRNGGIDNCLPKKLARDDNFIELERAFQLIVVSENSISNSGACVGKCDTSLVHISSDKNCKGDNCFQCEGVIRDCDSVSRITICPSNSSHRRYEWIKFSSIIVPMENSNHHHCSATAYTAESFRHGFPFGPLCEHCICTCEENTQFSTKSTSIISSQLSTSDVANNMVITGVKFVKADRIVYIQIKQAKMMPGGLIDQSTAHWKPIQHLFDEKNPDPTSFIVISKDVKTVNLNDLNCPSENYVLTGVGLGMSGKEGYSNRIALFIKCHLVDFESGKVLSNNTGRFEDPRPNEYKVKTGQMPADRVTDVYNRDLFDGYYVEFAMSHPIFDSGQSVIPWFDAQNVMSSPNVPLTAVGLHYKGGKESGGFLSFKLFSMRYSMFM